MNTKAAYLAALSACAALAMVAATAGPVRVSRRVQLPRHSWAKTLMLPDGQTVGARLQSALRQRAVMIRQQSSVGFPSLINWTELGPGNVGGRLNAVWVDPKNAAHILVGSASGGLWVSNDGGSSWSAVSDFPGVLTTSSIAELPSGTLLVGTGDFNTAVGDGILESSDGGSSWSPLASTAPTSQALYWAFVNSLAVSSSGVILAATGESNFGVAGGIERSSDGGQTWTSVWPVPAAAGTGGSGSGSTKPYSLDVAFDPNNPDDAVADDQNGGVIFSVDGGVTWAEGSGLPGTSNARVSLAFDPSVAGSVYALVDNNDGASPSGEVFHSSDDGATWTLLAGTAAFVNQDSGVSVGALCDDASSGPVECQGWYDNVILIEPHASGTAPTILAGGIDIFASTNGGVSWTQTGSWLGSDSDYLHADQHAFTYDPSTGTLYVGNDGGFYKQLTANTWSEQNQGLADTQFYSVTGHRGTTSTLNAVAGVPVTPIVGGAQDNGTLLYEGYSPGAAPQPDDWVPIFGGDGGFTQVDPANGNDVYGEYTHMQLFFSSQGGPGAQYYSAWPTDSKTLANFIAPFTLLPNSGAPATQMLAGGASLWLGTDIQNASPTWTAINSPAMPASPGNKNYINAVVTDPANANDVWVGFDDGEVWNSTDALAATPAWQQMGSSVLPSAEQVTSIWVVPGTPSTVYVTFNGYSGSGTNQQVWVSTDGGSSWQNAGAGLPDAPVFSLVTHPADPQVLYVGTLTGVYTSTDGGQSWFASSLGPADVEVRQLSWFDTSNPDDPTLLATTFGRGAWLGSPDYNATPTLSALSPAVIQAQSPATAVTITGTGFAQDVTTATLDGNPLPVTFQSATQLQATIPLSVLQVASTHSIVLTNPPPGGGTSSAATLTVADPVPVINSVQPDSVSTHAPNTTINVTGQGFVASSVVQWNGTPLPTSYVSTTSLSAIIPASDLQSATRAQITVDSPSPGGGASGAAVFSVNAPGGGGALGYGTLVLLLGANLVAWRRARERTRAVGG